MLLLAARQTCHRVTPDSPSGGVLNAAFTMSEKSVNQNCFSAMDSMFRWRHRNFLSVRLNGLWHDPGEWRICPAFDVRQHREPIDTYLRFSRRACASVGARGCGHG